MEITWHLVCVKLSMTEWRRHVGLSESYFVWLSSICLNETKSPKQLNTVFGFLPVKGNTVSVMMHTEQCCVGVCVCVWDGTGESRPDIRVYFKGSLQPNNRSLFPASLHCIAFIRECMYICVFFHLVSNEIRISADMTDLCYATQTPYKWVFMFLQMNGEILKSVLCQHLSWGCHKSIGIICLFLERSKSLHT